MRFLKNNVECNGQTCVGIKGDKGYRDYNSKGVENAKQNKVSNLTKTCTEHISVVMIIIFLSIEISGRCGFGA